MPEFNVHIFEEEGGLDPLKWQKVKAENAVDAIAIALRIESKFQGTPFLPECAYVQTGTRTHKNGVPLTCMRYSITPEKTIENKLTN